MSVEILPVYPNLFELNQDKLEEIETKCRKQNHLSSDDKLLEHISNNLLILKNFKLTKEDIYTTHRNMNLKFSKTNKYGAFVCRNEGKDAHMENLFKTLPENFGNGWSLKSNRTNEIELNGQHLRVSCFVWNGAETCPIEKSFTDKYFGYQRGDRDWFVTNIDSGLDIWVPDLLPAQIGLFCFSQSKNSAYNLDLNKYIQIMGLDRVTKQVKLLSSHKEYFWGNPCGPSSLDSSYVKDLEKVEEINNDTYHTIRYIIGDDEGMLIHFHDPDWIKENKDTKIQVFGLDFYVANVFNDREYLDFRKKYCVVLDEDDQSEAMETQAREQAPECIIQ